MKKVNTLMMRYRRRRVREVDDREADEDHPRERLHDGGLQAVPARRLLQHHPVPRRHPQGHAQPRHRLRQHRQRGVWVTDG